jgi:hypothetical protein
LDHAVAVALKRGTVVAERRGKVAHGEQALVFAEDSTCMKIGWHRLRV